MSEFASPSTPNHPGPLPPGAAAELLRELRNASVKFCQNEVAPLVERIKEGLLRQSERAEDPATKTSLLQVYRALQGRESALAAALLQSLPAELDRALSSDAPPALIEEFAQTRSQLAIVEEEDVQREIQVFHLIRELEGLCSDTASALTLRICHLRNLEIVEVRFNPFRPETFAIGLISGWETFEGSRALTHRLLEGFQAVEFLPLNALYAGLNKILIARGVMPKERYIVRKKSPPAGSAGLWVKSEVIGANTLEDDESGGAQNFNSARFLQQLAILSQQLASASPAPGAPAAASLGSAAQPSPALLAAMDALLAQVQAQTLPPPGTEASPASALLGAQQIRALRDVSQSSGAAEEGGSPDIDRSAIEMVARIFDYIIDDAGIPLQLKVLIADLQLPVLKAALTDPSFFLEDRHPARRVVDLLAQFGTFWEFLPADEVAETVRKDVTRLREASRRGQDHFAEVAQSLESFLAQLEARYEARLQNSLANVTAQEQRAEAMPEVDRALDQWFGSGPIEDPLAHFLRGPWRNVLCDYVISRPEEPEACAAAFADTSLLIWSILPKTNATEREHLLRQLPGLLASLNRGLDRIGADPASREPFLKFLMERHAQAIRPGVAAGPPRIIPVPQIEAVDGEQPVATVTRWNTLQLALGDWFILDQQSRPQSRFRLSWISPKRTRFVFTARESSEALSLNDEEVEERLRSGSLRLVDSAPIVQRAISASFDARE
jgi:hypothetical protein